MNPQLPQNEIRKHIYSIPPLLLAESENMLKKVPKILSGLAGEHIQSILFTGCGYSYAACLAIKNAFQRITKLPVQVLPAIEVSRFTDLGNPGLSSTLLIAISYSGEVSRINEALALYQKHSALTVGITGNLASKMREYCRFLIPVSAPPMERALPLRGFVMTYLALLSIGCTLAKMGNPAFSVSEITSRSCGARKIWKQHYPIWTRKPMPSRRMFGKLWLLNSSGRAMSGVRLFWGKSR